MKPHLELEVCCDGRSQTYVFGEFPVRIGRDPSFELHLPQAFVSRKHARIERDAGAGFTVVDEGGLNGVSVDGVKVGPKEWLPLADGAELRIEKLVAKVKMVVPDEKTTVLDDEPQMVMELLARAATAMDAYRGARAGAISELSDAVAAVPEAYRGSLTRKLVAFHEELVAEPGFRPLVNAWPGARREDRETGGEEGEIAGCALAELTRLASAYVPDAMPPGDAADVRALVGAVDRALRTFLMANAQIAFFCRGEGTGTGTGAGAGAGRGREGESVEWARQIGYALLDWRGGAAGETAARIERDSMEMALEVSRGIGEAQAAIEYVVEELSPAAIEAAARGVWPFAARARWRELARRHATVAATARERLSSRAARAGGGPDVPGAAGGLAAGPAARGTVRLPVRRVFWGL